jgi:23S rRNA (uracil1939-C5)-methyltransferase
MRAMEFDLTIQGLAAGGWGVGRHEGRVVFVPLTAPGDVIRCAVAEDRGRFAFGTVVDLVGPSPVRVSAPCPVFGRCGGCQWQHIRYERQLEAKRDILADALNRIGRLKEAPIPATAGSPRPYGWRIAVDLAFTGGGTDVSVGFYPQRGSQVVSIANCPVAADEINVRIARLAGAIANAGFGTAGEIKLVAGTGDRVSAHVALEKSAAVGRRQAERFCGEAGLAGVEITTKRIGSGGRTVGVSVFGDPVVSYPGWDGKKPAGLFCRASGFVQANPDINRELVDRLLSVDVAGKNVLDLYCGMGNLTVAMAAAGARVTGVEASRTSVEDAEKTVEAMGLPNVRLVVGSVGAVLSNPSTARKRWDAIVLDPPRTGARAVMERISDLRTDEIVYISCSPPTLARDLSILTERGWRLVSTAPMDMFPQTFHVETICRLTRG